MGGVIPGVEYVSFLRRRLLDLVDSFISVRDARIESKLPSRDPAPMLSEINLM